MHNLPDELCRLQQQWESATHPEEKEHVIKSFLSDCSFTELGLYVKKLETTEHRTRALLSGRSPHGEPLREALNELTNFRAAALDETRQRNFREYEPEIIEEIPAAEPQ